jgi:two-component system sensor histidine kinase BarA
MPDIPITGRPPGADDELHLPRRLRAAAAVLCAGTIVVLWTIAIVSIGRDYRQEEAAQRRVLETLVRSFAEQTERTINLVDQGLISVKRSVETRQAAGLRELLDRTIQRPLFLNLTVVDADGVVVETTFAQAKPGMTAVNRDYFEFHARNPDDVLFMGRRVDGRFQGKAIIPFTRRLNDAAGRFAGVVVGAVDPSYFTDFYGSLTLGAQDFIGFMGLDGYARAGRLGGPIPPWEDLRGPQDDMRGTHMYRHILETDFVTFRARSALDGVDRMIAIKRLAQYPVAVATGVGAEAVFAATRKRERVLLAVVGVATVLLAGMGWLLYRAAESLERRTAASDAANRLKSEFIAHMSHELRTPLHGILGFSEYLERRLRDPLERESALLIHQSGTHLLSIVDSILDLAKIEAGKLELHIDDTDVAGVVEGVAANHRVVTERKGVALRTEIAPSAHGLWRCDGVRLSSMLSNLLDNAAKFTERGEVTIHCDADAAGSMRFRVRDTGPGVSVTDQARIFERFRQGDTFVTRRHGGTGLGLALVRELALLMGGEIVLESTVGNGATFTLTLPFARARATTPSMEQAA